MADHTQVIQTVDHLELILRDISELMVPLKEYHAIYAHSLEEPSIMDTRRFT